VALNRAAAAQATSAFENRCTEKVYLAVLQGHVFPSRWPAQTQAEAEASRLPLPFGNKSHVKMKVKRKHVAEEDREVTWQDRALQVSVDRHYAALSLLLAGTDSSNTGPETKLSSDTTRLAQCAETRLLLQKLSTHPKEDFIVNKKLRKELRKVVSACGVQVEEVDQGAIKASMPPSLPPPPPIPSLP
jgi:hypothetical protein